MPAPVNDLCVNATAISGLPYSITGYDTTGATQSPDDPFNTAAGEVPFNTVWWTWTATTTGVACVSTLGSSYDTVVGVYTGSCGGPWTTVAENDDSPLGGTLTSLAFFAAQPGTTYAIVVGSLRAGGGSLSLSVTYLTQPTYPYDQTIDLCATGSAAPLLFGLLGTTADDVVGVFAYSATATIQTKIIGLLDELGNVADITTSSLATQFPINNGQALLVGIQSLTGCPAVTHVVINHSPRTLAPAGSLIISDDSSPFPAALLDGTTGSVLSFIKPFPPGEGGDVLPTGEIAVSDKLLFKAHVYGSDYTTVLGTTSLSPGLVVSIRTNQADKFYIADQGFGATPASVKIMDKTGALVRTITFATTSLTGAAPNRAETILYYTGLTAVSSKPVGRWDLVNNVALSNLAAGIAGLSPDRPLLVLADDTILVPYVAASQQITLLRYDSSGTVLNTYSFPLNTIGDFEVARALEGEDPTAFWVWERRANGISAFSKIRTSDGAVLTTFSQPQFELGVYQGTVTATPLAYFGHSESCPFFLTRRAIAPRPTATVPGTPPVVPGTCCSPTPTSTGITSPAPSSGTNKGGITFCTSYTGPSGVVPIGADPPDGDTLTGKRTVYAWLEMVHTNY